MVPLPDEGLGRQGSLAALVLDLIAFPSELGMCTEAPRCPRHPCALGFHNIPCGQSPKSISQKRIPRFRGMGPIWADEEAHSAQRTQPIAPGYSRGKNKDKSQGLGDLSRPAS